MAQKSPGIGFERSTASKIFLKEGVQPGLDFDKANALLPSRQFMLIARSVMPFQWLCLVWNGRSRAGNTSFRAVFGGSPSTGS